MTTVSTPPGIAAGPPFSGRSRWLAASLLLIGNVLQGIEFVLENPREDTADRVAYWTEHPTQVGWSMATGYLAVPFLIGGFAVLAALCLRSTPRLAVVSVVLLTLAMCGLAALHGFEGSAYGLSRSGEATAAVTVLEGDDLGVPGAVIFVTFLGGALFGVLCLVAASWLSPLVPRAVPLLLLAFAILDFGLGYGLVSHIVNVGAGAVLAWAVVRGYSRGSGPRSSGWRLPLPGSGRGVGDPAGSGQVPAGTAGQ